MEKEGGGTVEVDGEGKRWDSRGGWRRKEVGQ